jgi:F-box protein 28
MTYTKYIDMGVVCFVPGKVLDEMFHVLLNVRHHPNPPRAHELLQELRDISSMAMEHFDEKIVPQLRQKIKQSDMRLVLSAPDSTDVDTDDLIDPVDFQSTFFQSLNAANNSMAGPSGSALGVSAMTERCARLKRNQSQQFSYAIGLKQELALCRNKIADHDKRLLEANKRIATQDKKLKSSNLKVSELMQKITELTRRLFEYDQKFVDITTELTHVRSACGSNNDTDSKLSTESRTFAKRSSKSRVSKSEMPSRSLKTVNRRKSDCELTASVTSKVASHATGSKSSWNSKDNVHSVDCVTSATLVNDVMLCNEKLTFVFKGNDMDDKFIADCSKASTKVRKTLGEGSKSKPSKVSSANSIVQKMLTVESGKTADAKEGDFSAVDDMVLSVKNKVKKKLSTKDKLLADLGKARIDDKTIDKQKIDMCDVSEKNDKDANKEEGELKESKVVVRKRKVTEYKLVDDPLFLPDCSTRNRKVKRTKY